MQSDAETAAESILDLWSLGNAQERTARRDNDASRSLDTLHRRGCMFTAFMLHACYLRFVPSFLWEIGLLRRRRQGSCQSGVMRVALVRRQHDARQRRSTAHARSLPAQPIEPRKSSVSRSVPRRAKPGRDATGSVRSTPQPRRRAAVGVADEAEAASEAADPWTARSVFPGKSFSSIGSPAMKHVSSPAAGNSRAPARLATALNQSILSANGKETSGVSLCEQSTQMSLQGTGACLLTACEALHGGSPAQMQTHSVAHRPTTAELLASKVPYPLRRFAASMAPRRHCCWKPRG